MMRAFRDFAVGFLRGLGQRRASGGSSSAVPSPAGAEFPAETQPDVDYLEAGNEWASGLRGLAMLSRSRVDDVELREGLQRLKVAAEALAAHGRVTDAEAYLIAGGELGQLATRRGDKELRGRVLRMQT